VIFGFFFRFFFFFFLFLFFFLFFFLLFLEPERACYAYLVPLLITFVFQMLLLVLMIGSVLGSAVSGTEIFSGLSKDLETLLEECQAKAVTTVDVRVCLGKYDVNDSMKTLKQNTG
jgi:hypothetical protein